jgi:type I restriction enzyme S subunit
MEINKVKLGEISEIRLSNVDKKTKQNQPLVYLCNFTDVYNHWAITKILSKGFMKASATSNQIDRFSIHKGNVAITKDSETRDDIGVATYIADEIPNTLLGYHCALIIPNAEKLNGKYLNAFLNSKTARKYFENFASGSGQRYTLTDSSIANIKIPMISLAKQAQIGDLFSKIDKHIEICNTTLNKLSLISMTCFEHWFLQFDFMNDSGKPYASSGENMKAGKGYSKKIPSTWSVVKLKELITFEKGKIPKILDDRKTDSCPSKYLTIEVVNGGISKYCSPKNMPCTNGETLMVMDGAASGDVYVGYCGVVGSTFSCIKSKRKDIGDGLLYQLLSHLLPAYKKANTGSTIPHANKKYIGNLYVAIPNDATKYSCFFSGIVAEERYLRNTILKLKEIRDFLLPLLLNGQIKIS